MMDWAYGGGGAGGWIPLCAVVVGIALLACTLILIRANYRDRDDRPLSEAERELRLRLARGEIDVDEFLKEQAALRR